MKLTRPLVLALVALALAGGAYVLYQRYTAQQALPKGLIQANGRIEGETVTVAGKLPGRIAALHVREGDTVTAGQLIAELDSGQIDAKVAQATAAVQALQAQVRAAQTGLAALRKQVPLEVASAQSAVDQADAASTKARAAQAQSDRDAQRLEELAARGSVPRQRAELARLAAVASNADVAYSEQARIRAQKLAEQSLLGNDKVRARVDEIAALSAGLAQAEAVLAEARSASADLRITAPTAGVVVSRIRSAGEVVAAGSPIVDIVDLDSLYLKVYVPESQIGQLRLGLPARIYSDASPDQPFPAKVSFIASRAEFTPKEVQTIDERVKLTFAVKLQADVNPEHRLAPGMPADAMIRIDESTAWQKPKW
jgi:HlyD family secretion protein